MNRNFIRAVCCLFGVLLTVAVVKSKAACNGVTGLSASNVTNSSAKLNWAATACDSFLVKYYITGTTAYRYKLVKPGTATNVSVTALYPNTNYSWAIHTYCSGGQSGDYQVTPATFTTLNSSVYCQLVPNNTSTS